MGEIITSQWFWRITSLLMYQKLSIDALGKRKNARALKITEKHEFPSKELKICCVRHGFMIPESCGLRICLFGKLNDTVSEIRSFCDLKIL